MSGRASRATNAAVRAEPRGIGTARARDPLAREVKLLGALLGQVLVEQEGADALDLVERVRRSTIALRRDTARAADREALIADLADLDARSLEILIRATRRIGHPTMVTGRQSLTGRRAARPLAPWLVPALVEPRGS